MYKIKNNSIIREDGACIPLDLANKDYQQYLAWLSQGNTPLPADIQSQEPTPQSTTPELDAINQQLQAKLNAGVEFNNTKWYTDTVFQLQISAMLTAYQSGVLQAHHEVTIRDMNGNLHRMNYNMLKNLAAYILNYVQTCYAESWAAKDALKG